MTKYSSAITSDLEWSIVIIASTPFHRMTEKGVNEKHEPFNS